MSKHDSTYSPGWHTVHPASIAMQEQQVPVPKGHLLEQVDIIYPEGKAPKTGPTLHRRFQWQGPSLRCVEELPIQLPTDHQAIYWIYESPTADFPEVKDMQSLISWAQQVLLGLAPYQPLAEAARDQLAQLEQTASLSGPLFWEYSAGNESRSLYLSRHSLPNCQEVLGLTLAVY